MQYLIHSITHDILLALPDDATLEGIAIDAFLRQAPYDTYSLDDLVYDESIDNVRPLTDDEKLQRAKEAKLEELKSTIQSHFSNLPDSLADAVKAVKLVLKYALMLRQALETQDETVTNNLNLLEDHLKLLLQTFEVVYPDDYAIDCVARYSQDVVTGLTKYYQAKMAVLAATTITEVESIALAL